MDERQPAVGPDDDTYITCSGGFVCVSPDTRIASDVGELRIADVRVGDLVYSLEGDRIALVPVLKLVRTPVRDHHVVQLTLDDETVLEISDGDDDSGRRPLSLWTRPGEILARKQAARATGARTRRSSQRFASCPV